MDNKVPLVESETISEVIFSFKLYPAEQGGSGTAGVEKFPSSTLNKTPKFTGNNLKVYIDNMRVKCDFDLIIREDLNPNTCLELLNNGIRLIFDEREKDKEPFCFIDLNNIDMYDIDFINKEEDGKHKIRLRFIMKGLLQTKQFFNISKRHLDWFDLFRVKIYDYAIDQEEKIIPNEDKELITDMVINNNSAIECIYKDTALHVPDPYNYDTDKLRANLFAYNFKIIHACPETEEVYLKLIELIRNG